MKTLILFCSFLTFTSSGFAQVESLSEIEKQKENLETQLKQQMEQTKRDKDRYEETLKAIADKKAELEKLETYEQNFDQARIMAIDEITEKIRKLPFLQKLGAKAGFYKCLRTSLKEKNFLNHESCNAYEAPKLSDEEKADIERLKDTVGLSPIQIKVKKDFIPKEIQSKESLLKTWESNWKYSAAREEMIKGSIKTVEIQKAELEILPKYPEFTECDSNTPELNLENKEPFKGASFEGPFFGVPRDNQDGLGTCYANAAKNLLVGISGGNNVASFLDIALAYKNESGGLVSSGLDAGNSCVALNAIKKRGFCPQHFSPLESGERNHAGESLFNLDPYNYLATNVNMLKGFLGDLNTFQKSTNEISASVLSKAESMIETLKANPDIKLPLPVARFDVPERWKLKEAFSSKVRNKGFKEEDFLKEYDYAYKTFYPLYVKAVMDGKNLDQIFDLWKDKMAPFITKFGLEDSLAEFKRVYKLNAKEDIEDPKLKVQLRKSLDFLKEIMNKKDLPDSEFYLLCSNQAADALNFLGSLQPLMEKLRQNKLNEDKLFDKDGKFRSAAELMQLTVAPSCLNEENRVKPEPFTCKDGYDTINKIKKSGKSRADQIKMLRGNVVLSLVQGYPVGNSFDTASGAGHINTIVGLRFNKQDNRCEYLIRESQTGTSGWQSESALFDKVESITEVRRQK